LSVDDSIEDDLNEDQKKKTVSGSDETITDKPEDADLSIQKQAVKDDSKLPKTKKSYWGKH